MHKQVPKEFAPLVASFAIFFFVLCFGLLPSPFPHDTHNFPQFHSNDTIQQEPQPPYQKPIAVHPSHSFRNDTFLSLTPQSFSSISTGHECWLVGLFDLFLVIFLHFVIFFYSFSDSYNTGDETPFLTIFSATPTLSSLHSLRYGIVNCLIYPGMTPDFFNF